MKKQAEVGGMVGVLIAILIALAGFGLLMFVFVGKAPEKITGIAESEACRTSNEINYAFSISGKKLLPSACKTGPLVSFPTKEQGNLEDVKKDIADGLVRCWYNWLEGKDKNIFGKLLTDLGQPTDSRCFVCKHFGVSKTDYIKKTDSITFESLFRYLDTTTFSAYVPPSERNKEAKNDCEKSGGYCLARNPGSYEGEPVQPIPKWKCGNVGQTCYVKEKYITTYMDYFEGDSEGAGSGYIALLPLLPPKTGETTRPQIKPGIPYAITIVNPGTSFSGIALDKIFGSYSGEYPYLLVTEYDNVKSKCARQFGITEVK